jgi:DNA-directed RNA polymerase subunit L
MDVEILREDSSGFEVKLIGEDHTFLSLLTEFLNKNEKIQYAAYKIEHPLVGEPKLFFRLNKVLESEDIPISKLKGVGPKTAKQLENLNIITVSQLLLHEPEKLAKKSGIAVKSLSKYIDEARKMVPEDRFGYRAVLKNSLSELLKTLKQIKKTV